MSIQLDPSRDSALTPLGKITMQKQYCQPGESFQDAFARPALAFCGGDQELAQRIYDYASRHWFSYATPLITNGGTQQGLPISCFLNYVDDSIAGLAANFTENAFLCTNGGGIGSYWGSVRSVGEKTSKGVETPGAIPFMHVIDSQILAYHQGKARRGAAAMYMDVSHPEIVDFINMRSSSGAQERKNPNLHHGVCVSDAFMNAVLNDGDWNLVDPNSGNIKETVKARSLWINILTQRVQQGEPYIFFVDTANAALPAPLREKGLRVHHSNLCTEITLPTSKDRTAVCCLSSINVAKMDEWWPVREQFILDLVTMLDNVLDVFCETAPEPMWRAVASASSERSIGLGTLGFHTYLQLHAIPMDSAAAEKLNDEIYSTISHLAKEASKKLATERGEAPDMVGTGMRHAHLMAIAPNATSSIVCGGVSPSIEPMVANAFTQKTGSAFGEARNPALEKRLRELGQDTEEVWQSIILNDGSVQHLDFLGDHDKSVFLTAAETDASVMIRLAAQRQPYICQAQSLNLFLRPDVEAKELNKLHIDAWRAGLKSLYYLRSGSVKKTSVGVMPENLRPEPEAEGAVCNLGEECVACQA